jgi:3-hydroxyisobutyrate dehydrogenase-like beta-hydroxyacid dehydrogenase
MRVAFIGLGVMGYPMAGYLAGAGHEVTVFNRTTAKADAWCGQYEGSRADTPSDAASNAEIVFCCVGNDDDVRAVILGDDGVLNGISDGSIIVDHTTASATVAREVFDAAARKNVGFLDAPLSGGQAGAENGQLTIMIGGNADVYQRALPVMDCYAKACTLIGPVGSGQLTKLVNQICIAGDGESLGDDDPERVRIWFCGRVDAQGSENGARRGGAQRGKAGHDQARGRLLCGGAGARRKSVGYVQSYRPIGKIGV